MISFDERMTESIPDHSCHQRLTSITTSSTDYITQYIITGVEDFQTRLSSWPVFVLQSASTSRNFTLHTFVCLLTSYVTHDVFLLVYLVMSNSLKPKASATTPTECSTGSWARMTMRNELHVMRYSTARPSARRLPHTMPGQKRQFHGHDFTLTKWPGLRNAALINTPLIVTLGFALWYERQYPTYSRRSGEASNSVGGTRTEDQATQVE